MPYLRDYEFDSVEQLGSIPGGPWKPIRAFWWTASNFRSIDIRLCSLFIMSNPNRKSNELVNVASLLLKAYQHKAASISCTPSRQVTINLGYLYNSTFFFPLPTPSGARQILDDDAIVESAAWNTFYGDGMVWDQDFIESAAARALETLTDVIAKHPGHAEWVTTAYSVYNKESTKAITALEKLKARCATAGIRFIEQAYN